MAQAKNLIEYSDVNRWSTWTLRPPGNRARRAWHQPSVVAKRCEPPSCVGSCAADLVSQCSPSTSTLIAEAIGQMCGVTVDPEKIPKTPLPSHITPIVKPNIRDSTTTPELGSQ